MIRHLVDFVLDNDRALRILLALILLVLVACLTFFGDCVVGYR